jgi:tRNA-2-methylthio-N6-dimethylallyladenosine synthase
MKYTTATRSNSSIPGFACNDWQQIGASYTVLIYLHTYGCQMNAYDSQLVRTLLSTDNVNWTSKPDQADVILVNTCCVRQHAEERALGRLRQLISLKRHRPHLKVGILGCMAQQHGEDLFDQIPGLDWIVGPDAYRTLPELIAESKPKKTLLDVDSAESYDDIFPTSVKGPTAFLAIMRGCNNFCSYCIVPYVRGRERSRPLSSIVAEAEALVSQGISQITLLGQNVNSYRDETHDFADVLRAVAAVDGVQRVRFTTSHPKDISLRLVRAMAEIPEVCPLLHLPVQSGSNRILTLMNRGYTRSQYLQKVDMMRHAIPDIALSTDILVGFPGESDQDFQDTMDLLDQVRFHGAFSFRYSVRQGTAAAHLPDDVPESLKIARLEAVIEKQRWISNEIHQARIGDTLEVLAEAPAKKGNGYLMGRSPQDDIVVFAGNSSRIGDLLSIKIAQVRGFTLIGNPV